MGLLLECRGANPNLFGSNSQKPLSYAPMKGQEGMVGLLSDSSTPNHELSGERDRMPISVTDKSVSGKEVTHLPIATEPNVLHTPDGSRKRNGRSYKQRKKDRENKRRMGRDGQMGCEAVTHLPIAMEPAILSTADGSGKKRKKSSKQRRRDRKNRRRIVQDGQMRYTN